MLEDILKGKTRNYKEEKKILEKFLLRVKPYISQKRITDRLEQNGFNGIYILNDEDFSKLVDNSNVSGIYCPDEKIIILSEIGYYNDINIGVHEMGHAYLNGESKRKITIDNDNIIYGKGLEEGAISLLQSNCRINKIDKTSNIVYPFQSILFKQLNALYINSDIQEYDNLLIHLFMNPQSFIPLIRDIYSDIYLKELHNLNIKLAEKTAFKIISGSDALLDICDTQLFLYLSFFNSLFFNISNNGIINNCKDNDLFISSPYFEKTNEEKLFSCLFNDSLYMERMEEYLNKMLLIISDRLEKIDNDKSKSKILLPR